MIKVGECKALARENLLGRYGAVIGAQLLSSVVLLILGLAAAAALLFALYNGNVIGNVPAANIGLVAAGAVIFTIFLFLFIIAAIYLNLGFTKMMLNLCQGRAYGVGDIFYGFRKGSHIGRSIEVIIIKYLIGCAFSVIIEAANVIWGGLSVSNGLKGPSDTETWIFGAVVAVCIFLSWYMACGLMQGELLTLEDPDLKPMEALKQSMRLMKGHKLKAFWLMSFSFVFWDMLTAFCPPAALWTVPYAICTNVVFFLGVKDELWRLPGRKNAGTAGAFAGAAGEGAHETDAIDGTYTAGDDAAEQEAQSNNAADAAKAVCAGADNEDTGAPVPGNADKIADKPAAYNEDSQKNEPPAEAAAGIPAAEPESSPAEVTDENFAEETL